MRSLSLLLLSALLLSAVPAFAAGSVSNLPVGSWSDEAWEVLRLTNKERMSRGLNPLATSVKHQTAADVRAEELVEDYRADHSRPDGSPYYTAIDEQNIDYMTAGENIAQGYSSAREVVNAWMNSQGHRENILRNSFVMMGVGFNSRGYTWAQDFTDSDRGFSSMEIAAGQTVIPVDGQLDSLGAVVVLRGESFGDCYMPVIDEMCQWAGSGKEGDYTVTVRYGSLTARFDVTVSSTPTSSGGESSSAPVTPSSSTTVSEGDFKAVVSGGAATITAYTGKTGYETALVIPDTIDGYAVTGIGEAVFKGKNFASVTFPASLRSIGDSAFQSCSCTGPLILPEGLQTIGGRAFDGSSFSGRVFIPASVTSIGIYAFSYMYSVTAFAVSPSNSCYSSYGGALYDKNRTVLYNYPIASDMEAYAVPESVELLYCTSFAKTQLKDLYVLNSYADCMTYTFYWTNVQVWCRGALSSSMIGLNSISRLYSPMPLDIRDADDSAIQSAVAATEARDRTIPLEPESQTVVKPSSGKSYSLVSLLFGEGDFSRTWQSRTRTATGESVHNNPNSIKEGSKVLYQVVPAQGSTLISFSVFDDAGNKLDFTAGANGVYNFTMPDSKVFVCVKVEPNGYKLPSLPFKDVSADDYFFDAVCWALENGVTQGTSADTFSPTDTCTRGQVVTFLWRAMGCPEPKSADNPFEDVKESAYYYKPVLWAVEKGITNGTDAAHFTPAQTCSTAHILTFLYRALGIGANGWYEVAEAWAKGAGLLDGLDVTVAPGVECPRCDVVLFLYRKLA